MLPEKKKIFEEVTLMQYRAGELAQRLGEDAQISGRQFPLSSFPSPEACFSSLTFHARGLYQSLLPLVKAC